MTGWYIWLKDLKSAILVELNRSIIMEDQEAPGNIWTNLVCTNFVRKAEQLIVQWCKLYARLDMM